MLNIFFSKRFLQKYALVGLIIAGAILIGFFGFTPETKAQVLSCPSGAEICSENMCVLLGAGPTSCLPGETAYCIAGTETGPICGATTCLAGYTYGCIPPSVTCSGGKTPGQTQDCGSDPICTGTQTCQSDGTWSSCDYSATDWDPCNDGNACTTGDRCDYWGACVSGTNIPVNGTWSGCGASAICVGASCGGTCPGSPPVCTTCSGGYTPGQTKTCGTSPCTGTQTCQSSGSWSVCNYSGSDWTPCNDGNACTTGDRCDYWGACVSGSTLNCNDSNACTSDSCNTSTGCVNTAISCNDSNACTSDSCNTSTGCVNTTISCNDSNACTTDTCNTSTGCVFTNNPVSSSCGSSNNSCIAGTLNDIADDATNYLWSCLGICGGSTANCSLAKPITPISVTLTASPPGPLTAPGATTLTWTTTGSPTSCTASNFWSGAKTASGGSELRSAIPASTQIFDITCSKAGTSDATARATVVVNPSPPVVTLTASPTTGTSPLTSTLTWTVSGASVTSCTAGGGWSGSKSTAGSSQVITGIITGTTYTLYCTNAGGDSNTASATVTPTGAISVTLTASPPGPLTAPGATTLTWTTTGSPTSCVASNFWSGVKNASGGSELRSGIPASTQIFDITCSKAGVSDATASVSVVVSAATPVPVTTFTANPLTMTLPTNSTILTWSATNSPTGCIASSNPVNANWNGAKAVSGTQTISGLAAGTYLFGLYCTNAGGNSATINQTVVVNAATAISAVSVTPASGSGLGPQTFSYLYSDTSGASNILQVYSLLRESVVPDNACYVTYLKSTNSLYLMNDAGTAWSSPVVIGTVGTLQNNQCTINVGGSSVLINGNDFTLNLPITFKPAFAGAKVNWMYAYNTSINTGWQNRGSWTVPAAACVAAGTGTGLTGSYYDGINFNTFVTTRTDAAVNFNPADALGVSYANSPDGNTFSVGWEGKIEPRCTETYTFKTYSDDGVRLWVNGVQVINNWTDHGPTYNTGTIALTAGTKYDIKLEFYENGGGAVVQLYWSSPSTAEQIIPVTQLYVSVADPSGAGGNNTPCERINMWWFRNGASNYNVYRNTVNNSATAAKIQNNIAYTDPTYGGFTDSPGTGLVPVTTYYYWIENVGGTSRVPVIFGSVYNVQTAACPVATANISASNLTPPWGGDTTISWWSTGATSCEVIGTTWTGTSGSQLVTGLTVDKTYTLSCQPPGPNSIDSVFVDVQAQPTNTLNVIKSGQGTVTGVSNPAQTNINCGVNCQATYTSDTIITLTATPNTGRIFTGWSGDCSGRGICTVTMSSSRTVYANFTVDPNYSEF